MTLRRRPLIRACPLCGIAMQASKSRESMTEFDTFQRNACQTTITEAAAARRPGESRLAARQVLARPWNFRRLWNSA